METNVYLFPSIIKKNQFPCMSYENLAFIFAVGITPTNCGYEEISIPQNTCNGFTSESPTHSLTPITGLQSSTSSR